MNRRRRRWMLLAAGLLSTAALATAAPGRAAGAAAAPFSGGEWRLVRAERDGRPVPMPAETPVTLAVDRNGMVAGKACINRYFGKLAAEHGGRLSWTGPIGSTRMSGAPELMQAEADYLMLLGRTGRWRVEGGRLVLESEDGAARLRFRR